MKLVRITYPVEFQSEDQLLDHIRNLNLYDLVESKLEDAERNGFIHEKNLVTIEDGILTEYAFVTDEGEVIIKDLAYKCHIDLKIENYTTRLLEKNLLPKSSELFEIAETFIEQNLTVDFILEKVNRYGANSLNATDYKVLLRF